MSSFRTLHELDPSTFKEFVMKKILFAVLALVATLFTQLSYSAERVCSNLNRSAQCASQNKDTNPGRENGWLLQGKPNIAPYLPHDLVSTKKLWQYICDERGNAQSLPNGTATGNCGDYISAGNKTKWRVHLGEQRVADAIYQISTDGSIREHVRLAGHTAFHKVLYMSPEAEQIATVNGYQFDSRTNTMVAISSGSQQTAQSAPSVPVVLPAPQVASVDCNKLNGFVAKAQCIANSAAALGVLKKP